MSVEIIEQSIDATISSSGDKLTGRLKQLQQIFLDQGDSGNAQKVAQLMEKWENGEFVLSFCGHFSAGKSTMINTLMGSEILPSSPIPTSANVVKMKTGEPKAVAYFKNKSPLILDYVEELERLKEYCKDGDKVQTVEITYENDFLINGACLLDTPGIDSTDGAHRVATESAMHLADAVVYMMDYNHVQSELNLHFTKMIKEKGKKLFLVINQIDKHFDLELDFSAFRTSVEEAFFNWGIEPDGMYFTTLKIPDHPENQFEEFHDQLYSLFTQKDQLLQESILRAAKELVEDHGVVLAAKAEKQKKQWEQIAGSADIEKVYAVSMEIKARVEQWESAPERLRSDAVNELQNILDNANLMPYATREKATKYLESCQPGFKVGFLFAASKTKKEKEERLATYYQEIKEQVKANLQWHVKDLLTRVQKACGVENQQGYINRMDVLEAEFTPDFISSRVREGFRLTGDSVLNYCQEISQAIKTRYRKWLMEYMDEMLLSFREQAAKEVQKLLEENSQILSVKEAVEGLRMMEADRQAYLHQLRAQLFQAVEGQEAPGRKHFSSDIPLRTRRANKNFSLVSKQTVSTLVLDNHKVQTTPFKQDYKAKLQKAAGVLRQAADIIHPLPGQSIASHNMRVRAERLEENLFTVALFGAFSAGKSSFANALMGDMVLPVSPNPTTATINKILPPTERYSHGTVRVKLKYKEDMTNEVLESLAIFRIQAYSLEEALPKISRIQADDILPSAKPHYTFLRAVEKGIEFVAEQFGEELLVGLDEFKELVAKEERACFVEWIELYYSCAITEQGISLVDTPGADSINARHTGVAFDYIKNSDAVLFVTYYNHAFSHADREFLEQLGRVKDTFEMDKMFFLVNAADLAKSKDELQGVVEHVKDNLVACGIRQPRIYPVSSQTALLARMLSAGKLPPSSERIYRERTGSLEKLMPPREAITYSGFQAFETDFIRFTIEELTDVAIQSAAGEMKRAKKRLCSLIGSAKEGDEARERKRKKMIELRKNDRNLLSTYSVASEIQTVEKETEELLFYVKQRLFLRLNELFTLSFNPSVLNEEATHHIKSLLQQCFDEWMRNVAFTLTQEIRATSLRLEKIANEQLKNLFFEWREKMGAQVTEEPQGCKLEVPEVPEDVWYDPHSTKRILGLFKSPKKFFEQGGREIFRSELEQWLEVPVNAHMERCLQIMKEYYGTSLAHMTSQMKDQLTEQMEAYYVGMLAALEERMDIHEWEETYHKLEELEKNFKKYKSIRIHG